MNNKIFIDSDIILDFLLDRKPFSDDAEVLFNHFEKNKLTAYSTSVVFSNVFYILNDINKKKDAVKTLNSLNRIIKILPTTNNAMIKAFTCKLRDFEDSIQYETCKENNVDIILTRNSRDFKRGDIKVLTASEFILINL